MPATLPIREQTYVLCRRVTAIPTWHSTSPVGGGATPSADPTNLLHRLLGEPQGSVRSGDDVDRRATGSGEGELADAPTRGDPPYLVGVLFGKPQSTIWPSDNSDR